MSVGKGGVDFIKNSLLNSALDCSTKIYKIFNSALERNVELNFRLKLQNFNHLEMGFGLKAVEPIYENREIMKIPLVTGFNGMDLVDFREDVSTTTVKELCWKIAKTFYPDSDSLKFRQDKNFQNQMLMWQVLLNSYYKDAYNHDLVDAFPETDLTQPLYAGKEIFDLISSRNLRKYYYENKLFFQMLYDLISKEAIYELTPDQVAWAYNNVLARKMIIIEPNTKTPYQVILPISDYINHSSVEANCIAEPYYDDENKKSYVSIKAAKFIKENDQLFFDYGPMYNKKFMNMYGFFDNDNPIKQSDFYFIGSLSNLKAHLEFRGDEQILNEFITHFESSRDIRQSILAKNSLSFEMFTPEFNLMLYNDKFDNQFIKFLRIVYLNNKDLLNNREVIMSYDFNTLFSFENERKVFAFIQFILERHFSFVKDKKHSELIKGLGPIIDVEKYKTKCMYKLEEEEKTLLEKNISYVNKKMRSLL